MKRQYVLALTLSALLGGSLAHAAPAEMDGAPVVELAKSGTVGSAKFAAEGPVYPLVQLDAPSYEQSKAFSDDRRRALGLGKPLAIGFPRDTTKATVDLDSLKWQTLADGSRAAHLSIGSDGAVALRAAIAFDANGRAANTAGLTLRFRGGNGQVFEQAGSELAADELNWSPVVAGDAMTVEIVLAANARAGGMRLSVPQVSHLDIEPTASVRDIAKGIGDSDWCENDVACRGNPSAGFLEASRSVARMTYVQGGKSWLCTGALLNNSFSPKKHLFWTAAHCISAASVARTLQTYWSMQYAACGSTTLHSAYTTLTGGANLRHANVQRDTSLLELRSAPPANAFYAGWNSAAISSTGGAIEGIHHPSGDVKKYSLGRVTGLNTSLDGRGPFYRVVWSDGVTEGGSSGSPLFTVSGSGSYQLRGGLYGGTSFCSAQSDPDGYSRFADVYSTISQYLSP
ncbi:MAG TPA: trypsin-like peptidase domain-containing protein [Tahibacter sp.]|nr:trypsin-like peptidase domain-containing protein [Tahibacter sp.]